MSRKCLSERGEDNPDLRRLDGGVDELVQLAVLHREVVALSDGGLRTGGGVRRRRAHREDAGTSQPTPEEMRARLVVSCPGWLRDLMREKPTMVEIVTA